MGTKKRIEYVDIFRACGIILMIMGHIGFGGMFDKFIHGFHMPMFFFISGMMYRKKEGLITREDKRGYLWNYIKRKAYTLLIPYFLFGIIYYVFWLSFNSRYIDWYAPVEHLLWINNYGLPYAGGLWFLTALFFTDVIYAFIDIAVENKLKYWIFAGIALLGNTAYYILPFELPFSLGASFVGVGLFCLGNVLMQFICREAKLEKIISLPLPFSIILGVIASVVIYINEPVNMREGWYRHIALFWTGAVLAIIAGLNLSRIIHQKMKGGRRVFSVIDEWLQSVGKNSMAYVCLNQFIILGIQHVVGRLRLESTYVVLKILIRLVILMLTLVCCFLADRLIEWSGFGLLVGRKAVAGNDKNLKIKKRFSVMIYCVLCISLVVCFANERMTKSVTEEAISKPVVQNAELLDKDEYKGAEQLIEDVKANIEYAKNFEECTDGRYAFYTDSTQISIAKKLTVRQKLLLNREIKSCENYKSVDELYLPNINDSNCENAIRPWAHRSYVLANGVYFGLVDDSEKEEVLEKTILIIHTLSKNHCSNISTGWGGGWQTAFWSENIAFAAWLVWDDLDKTTQGYVVNMLTYEANCMLDYEVPYYQDKYGNIVYQGDTKAEENSWNSRVLALAVCMMPENENVGRWEDKLEELLLSSTAVLSDVVSNQTVDGYTLCDVLGGANINDDGTVTNHNKVHIDYSSCVMEGMIETYIIFSLAGRETPSAVTRNFDLIYGALVNVDLGTYDNSKSGCYFYERSEDGKPTQMVKMPGENDWGGEWYASYYLNDTIAELFSCDNLCPKDLKGSEWSDVHLEAVSEMINRKESNGHTYGGFFEDGENDFVSGELYQMQNLMKAYILRRLDN